jgi:hypothetical protein
MRSREGLAVVIATMATASHATTIDDLLETLRTGSGLRDATALISESSRSDNTEETCVRLMRKPGLAVEVYGARREAEVAEARLPALRALAFPPVPPH